MHIRSSKDMDTSTQYQIVVSGELGASWGDWLGDVLVESHLEATTPDRTIIIGAIPDQAALRGLLNKIWDLNLTLISVNLQENEF